MITNFYPCNFTCLSDFFRRLAKKTSVILYCQTTAINLQIKHGLTMAVKDKHKSDKDKIKRFVFDFDSLSKIVSFTNGKNNSNYAITDKQGRILLKGQFSQTVQLDVSSLETGYYTAVLFNDAVIENYPFKIQ